MCSGYLSSRTQWLTKSFCAVGAYVLVLSLVFPAYAGLPPTTSTIIGDTADVTTFHFDFPNFTGTHTGTRLTLGVNSIAGGGTGQVTANAALNALLPSQTTNSGKFLRTDGTNASWQTASGSGGISTINALTAADQFLMTGTSGTDFTINSTTDTHTFNLPVASATNTGKLSSTDWSTFNGKFTLPAFTGGSVIFSDGSTLAENNANFFWDDSLLRLDIGNPGAPSGDFTARLRNQWTTTDPTDNLLVNNFNSVNYTITDDNSTNLLNTESQLLFSIPAGKSNSALTANHYSLIGRGDSGDEGSVNLAANYLGSITHGGSALKHTALYAAFMHAFDSIGSDGLIDNMYDFYAQGGSPGAGAITNRYGIVIEPDSGYTKSNWLSGRSQIGGTSFSTPTETLHVDGDLSATKSVTDNVAVTGLFSATTDTTVDGSNNTQGLQTSVVAKVQSGATNDKVAAGLVNTVQRGDGTDDGTLDTLNGVTSLLFHNSGASGVTNKSYGYASILITQQGTITDHYDFYSERAPAGGTLTNHWGVYVKDDGATPVKNFLSGQTKLGGSGFTATSDNLYVEGDATLTGVIHSVDTNESVDPNNRHLIKNGYNAVDWEDDKLTDSGGNDSIDWKNRILKDAGTNVVLDYSASDAIELKVHLKSTGTPPSATVDANAGTSATCTVSQATDMAGTVQLVTGSIGWAAGAQCAITFAVPYGIAPKCQFTPGNSNAALAALNFYATKTVSDLTLNFINPDIIATTYEWDYSCVETQ